MSTSITANRIYQRGRYAAEDFKEVAPDTLIVRGLKKPTVLSSGLYTPEAGAVGEVQEAVTHTRACLAFEVIALPVEMSKGNPLRLAVGDVVLCRNVLVDPLLGDEFATTDLYLGVVSVLERAAGPEPEAA